MNFALSGWYWEIWQDQLDTHGDHGEEHAPDQGGDCDGEICIIIGETKRIDIHLLCKTELYFIYC